MARFSGNIGFSLTKETEPGIWEAQITERPYKGDIKQDLVKNSPMVDSVNQSVIYQNRYEIMVDSFFKEHQHEVLYVKLGEVRWSIGYIEEISGPRVTIRFGGVYNGPTP